MRKQGNRVRIVAELISAADGRSLWSETYDRDLKDVFAVQSEIAKAVADQMKVKLLGQEPRSDAAPSNENLAAHNAVLQSDFYFQQQTAESVRRAITFLEEAVRLDPNYALAYAKLSQAWRQYGATFATDATENDEIAYNKARLAGEKALSFGAGSYSSTHGNRFARHDSRPQFADAEKQFRQVLQSSPSDAAAKSALCNALLAQGRLTEARANLSEALRWTLSSLVRGTASAGSSLGWADTERSRGAISQRTRNSAARCPFS